MSADFVFLMLFQVYQEVFLAISAIVTGFAIIVSIMAVIYRTFSFGLSKQEE